MTKKNNILYILFILMGGLLQQCSKTNDATYENMLCVLKLKYGEELINYFYEIVYYQDYVGPKDYLSRWDEDIVLSIEGELWPNDSIYVANAVTQINDLEIPLKVCLTSDTSVANMRMYFGSFKYLEQKLDLKDYPLFRGVGTLFLQDSHIKSARIGISNDSGAYGRIYAQSDSAILRQGIIFQELFQSLGATGDSWLHRESLFFEGINKTINLNEIDRNLIRFLYEPALPSNYSRRRFEVDFRDMLHTVNAKKKLLEYVRIKKIPISHLEKINRYAITDSALFKFPDKIFVTLNGTYDKTDSLFCVNAVDEFNKITQSFKLFIAVNDIYSNPCIKLHFLRTPSDTASITGKMSVLHTKLMLRRRVLGDIKIWHPKSQSWQKRLHKNRLIVKSIYKTIAFNNIVEEIAAVDSLNKINLFSEYKDMLALFYNPVIPNGFTKKEMEEVINELKTQN